MKKLVLCMLAAWLLAGCVPGLSPACLASYDQVASAADMAAVEAVGVEGMYPVYGTDVADGVYDVTVESSSSMFSIQKAVLTVKDGGMTADITLSGTGYLKLFMGTSAEAAGSGEDAYIGYVEGDDGAYTYTVPVEALDTAISCAAYSRRKEMWYDRSLLFRADSLPEGAVLVELPDYEALEKEARDARIQAMRAEQEARQAAEPAAVELADGAYEIDVSLSGGSGKASVGSPARLIVKDGRAYARIQWSSPHYDYMLVGGEKYLPVGTEDGSVFEIPVAAFDEALPVVADTTAMSTPHEIEYALTFAAGTIRGENGAAFSAIWLLAAVLAAVVLLAALLRRRRKKPA